MGSEPGSVSVRRDTAVREEGPRERASEKGVERGASEKGVERGVERGGACVQAEDPMALPYGPIQQLPTAAHSCLTPPLRTGGRRVPVPVPVLALAA